MIKIATIDTGTNQVSLKIHQLSAGGGINKWQELYHEAIFIRLGEGLSKTGIISRPAMLRLRDALLKFQSIIQQHRVKEVRLIGTSASRDAKNANELIAFVKKETGLDYHIISGDEEAQLMFAGAISALPKSLGNCVVMDIGGGSTELAFGNTTSGQLIKKVSVNVGTVRFSEKYRLKLPAGRPKVQQLTNAINSALCMASLPKEAYNCPLITAGGPPYILTKMTSDFSQVTPEASLILFEHFKKWTAKLYTLTPDQVLAINPAQLAGRQDLFPLGLHIGQEIYRYFKSDKLVIVSAGLHEGLRQQFASSID